MVFLQPDRDDVRTYWQTLMALGFLLLAAGELALCCVRMGPAAAAGGPLGLVLLSAGVLNLYAPLRHTAWTGCPLQGLAGAVYLAAGAWLLFSPATRAAAVLPVLGACFIAGGALRMYAALDEQQPQRSWAALSGGASAMLGVLMLLAWPEAGIETLGELAALGLFVSGITYLGLARSGWQEEQQREQQAEQQDGRSMAPAVPSIRVS